MAEMAIASVGLATAQGGVRDILEGSPLRPPAEVPWPRAPGAVCRLCRPAAGLDFSLSGPERIRRLAGEALRECLGKTPCAAGTPLLLGSCNGSADGLDPGDWLNAFDWEQVLRSTPWEGARLPVVSGSCASGLHALYLAGRLLEGGTDEVVVLCADILSRISHDHFESLRVLAPHSMPAWQPDSLGFIPGEAAVALRLRRPEADPQAPRLIGPFLSSIIRNDDPNRLPGRGEEGEAAGLKSPPLPGLDPGASLRPGLIIGLGTGPPPIDAWELRALRACVDKRVPLATTLVHFGHTLGSSGLLAAGLSALALRSRRPLAALNMAERRAAADGRPLARQTCASGGALILCRALSGAVAVAGVQDPSRPWADSLQAPAPRFLPPAFDRPPVLTLPILRQAAEQAARHRPRQPPDLLMVRMGLPLIPPRRAFVSDRLLPSAAAEVTPGFTAQLIAAVWGFDGAALCLVGGRSADLEANRLIQACRRSKQRVSLVEIKGISDHPDIEWRVEQ